jgi:VCBS repeat-containing protein
VGVVAGLSETFTVSSSAVGELGTLTVNPNGAFVFTIDPTNGNASRLTNDATAVFDVNVASGSTPTNVTTQTLSITIAVPSS